MAGFIDLLVFEAEPTQIVPRQNTDRPAAQNTDRLNARMAKGTAHKVSYWDRIADNGQDSGSAVQNAYLRRGRRMLHLDKGQGVAWYNDVTMK